MSKRYIVMKPLAAAIMVASLGSGASLWGPAFAQEDAMRHTALAQHRIEHPNEALMEQRADDAMVHIAMARDDLHRNDASSARVEVQAAKLILDTVEATLPSHKVHQRISVAKSHLSHLPPREVASDLVPIRVAIDELVELVPMKLIDQYYEHVDQIQGDLERAEREHALNLLIELDEGITVSEVDMPLGSTRHHVADALAAIDKGQLDEAQKALKAAEDHLVVLSLGEVDEPTLAAGAALSRAERHYRGGAYDQAKAEVENAIGWLESGAKAGDEKARGLAKDVLDEARSLLVHIERRAEDAGKRLAHAAMAAHVLGKRNLALHGGRGFVHGGGHPHPLLSDLADAQFYVSRAELELDRGREFGEMDKGKASALGELERAQSYLESAEAEAPIGEKAAVKVALTELKRLESDPDNTLTMGMLEKHLRALIASSS